MWGNHSGGHRHKKERNCLNRTTPPPPWVWFVRECPVPGYRTHFSITSQPPASPLPRQLLYQNKNTCNTEKRIVCVLSIASFNPLTKGPQRFRALCPYVTCPNCWTPPPPLLPPVNHRNTPIPTLKSLSYVPEKDYE